MSSSRASGRHWEENAVDMYLSTDDEGDGSRRNRKKSGAKASTNKQLAIELERAKQVAFRRMERHQAMEMERAFAVLDNVPERESAALRGQWKKAKSPLDAAHNPFIDNEAVEAGESDSDMEEANSKMQEEDSFTGEGSPSVSDSVSIVDSLSQAMSLPSVGGMSDEASDDSEDCTMYDDFIASRDVVRAQIQAEDSKRKRHQFCDSSSEEDQSSSHSCSGNSGSMETEEEASFSSVV